MTRRIEPEDLYAIKLVEDPQITPDGERVAYVVVEIDHKTYEYHRSIWVTATDGGEPRRYTAGDNDTTPRWSPDGRSLAFLRAPAGEVKPKSEEERDRGVGKPQLWLLPADGGEATQLTWARWGVSGAAWSPDGAYLVYVAEVGEPDDPEAEDARLHEDDSPLEKHVPAVRRIDRLWNRLDGKGWIYERRSHLFRIRSEGGQPEQLTDGDWDDGSPAVSPDGSRIAFTSDRTKERWSWPANDIWVLDLPSKRLTRLTDETVYAGPPSWSPDGRQVAFTAGRRRHEDGYSDLVVADVDAPGKTRTLTTDFLPTFSDTAIDDQRVGHGGPINWSTDGRQIYSQAAGRGSTLVYAVLAEGGTPRVVVGGQRRIYALSMDRDRRRIALASSDPSTPGDLFVHDMAGGRTRRLTELNAQLFREVDLAPVEEFTFKGADGWDIHGWIVRPNPHPHAGEGKAQPPPAILEIHGGPMAMYSWSFFFEFQLLASHGYAVVFTNPRGSTGYGRAFSAAVNNDWGGKDFQDVMAGIDAAVANGWVDPDRLGVAGGSYGGYMTNWTVGHTDRFKAAVTMRCVSNLASIFGTGDLDWILTIDTMDAVPWKDLDRLMEHSPITYVEKITTPLLILHGERDLRCPISEGEQLFTALKLLGREVRMVRFEGQSHDLSRNGHPRSRAIRLRHIVSWFISHIRTEVVPARKEHPHAAPTPAESRTV